MKRGVVGVLFFGFLLSLILILSSSLLTAENSNSLSDCKFVDVVSGVEVDRSSCFTNTCEAVPKDPFINPDSGICVGAGIVGLNVAFFTYEQLGQCTSRYKFDYPERNYADDETYCANLGQAKCLKDDRCIYENYLIYTNQLYWENSGPFNSLGTSQNRLTWYLDTENITSDFESSFNMAIQSPFLEDGEIVFFKIYGTYGKTGAPDDAYNKEIKGNQAFSAVVDENGKASVEVIFKTEDLVTLDFPREPIFYFTVEKADGSLNPRVSSEDPVPYLDIVKKIGTCKGEISCEAFVSEDDCLSVKSEYGVCGWNKDSNSCVGENESLSCNNLPDENTCAVRFGDYCSWKDDSLWKNLLSWFRNIFR